MTNVELYEALKGSIPEDAARMIAEAFHPARDLATRHDLAELRSAMQADVADVRVDVAALRGDVAALRAEVVALPTMRWMLVLMVPVWLGAWGTVIAVVLKG